MLDWFKKKREELKQRREYERQIAKQLEKRKVARKEAARLAKLVARGELTIDEAVMLSRRLRKRKLQQLEKKFTSRREPPTIQFDHIWGDVIGQGQKKKKRKKRDPLDDIFL